MNRYMLYISLLALSACGGGGGGDKTPEHEPDSSDGCVFGGGSLPFGTVSIKQVRAELFSFVKVSETVYETESPTVTLAGNVLAQVHDKVEVTNDTTGEKKAARGWIEVSALGCPVGYWEADSIALDLGSNSISVDDSNDVDTVTVRRVVDITAPSVIDEFPAAGSSSASTGTRIRAKFDDFMDASTINTSTILLFDQDGEQLSGRVTFDAPAREVTFEPDRELLMMSVYTVTIANDVTDDAGHPLLQDYTWSFTTQDDGVAPEMLLTLPGSGAVCVAPDAAIQARFSEPLSPATLDATSVAVEDSSGAAVTGSIFMDALTLSFIPDGPLTLGENYTVRLSDSITDYGGMPLAAQSWSFATEYEAEGTWTQISVPAIDTRDKHTAIWTGTEMIIFGGQGAGSLPAVGAARFNPETDQWKEISTSGMPDSRWEHTATWTGSEMVVWGGRNWSWDIGNGGRYDPATDSWQPVSNVNSPSARHLHSAVWTGTEVIIWGGDQIGPDLNDGARYDPETDTWTPVSTVNAPLPREMHRAVWDGQFMIVWGGRSTENGLRLKDGAMYDPVADAWLPLPTENAPNPANSGMLLPAVAWTGIDMFVLSHYRNYEEDEWTGEWSMVDRSEARRFNSRSDWQMVVESCNSQAVPNAVWLEGRMVSFNDDYTDGYFYDEQRNAWIPVAPFPGQPTSDASILATDGAIVIFGGDDASPSRRDPRVVGYRLTF